MNTDSLLWRIVARLRPAIHTTEDPQEQLILYLNALPVLLMGPFTLAGIVWLVAVTDWAAIPAHWDTLALLLVGLLALRVYAYRLYFETRSGDLIPVSGSLDSLVLWSGALILGPVALWAMVLEGLAGVGQTIWRQVRHKQPVSAWDHISGFCQGAGISVFITLAGLAIFRALGGDYPLSGFALADWGPAVVALIAAGIMFQVIFYVLMRSIDTYMGQQNTTLLGLFVAITTLITIPFCILGALTYSEGTPGLYVLFVAWVLVVNYMAYHLSRTNERSQQRARELARLETLGEALIQAPPDLSTLEDILREHAGKMFPADRFEIRLFAPRANGDGIPAGLCWPDLTLTYPPDRPPLHDAQWDTLNAANQTHIEVPDVVPPEANMRFGHALIVPIAADDPGEEGGEKEQLLGGIALLRHHTNGQTRHSLAALQSLAAQIGSAYYRAHVHLETLAAQKMAQELELAGQIQAKFLPGNVPQIAGWDIAAGLTPARQTSGDFYDFVPFADGRLGVVVADVADKGTGAALYMALSRTLIRTFALQYPDEPERALQAANDRLLTDTESDQFVTVFYGVLDSERGTLTYANAGHNPGYVLRADDPGCAPDELTRTGVPLGMFEGLAWKRATVTLKTGDALVLYTDGVSEAQDAADAEFGEDRLCDTVRTQMAQPAAAIHTAVTRAVQDFVGDAPQFDDITLLVALRR